MSETVDDTKTVSDKKKGVGKQTASHAKEKLLKSNKYKDKRDLISALLEDDKEYTTAGVDKLISDYLKKEVK